MKLCGELMKTDIISCSMDSSVDKVAKLMRFTDESYIPLVADTKNKKVVGGLSDRDLLERVLSEGRHPRYTLAKDIVSKDLVTCGPNAPLDFVLSLMSNNGITNIPVVSRRGFLKGVISLSDIVDYYQYEKVPVPESQTA